MDLTKLNENVRRERHPLPAVEQTLAQIAGQGFVALSRAPVNSAEGSDNLFREEVEAYIQTAVQSLPAKKFRNFVCRGGLRDRNFQSW